jgi:hypothetical protein
VLTNVIESPGAIIRVYRPILTPEERAKRMERIKEAAAKLIIAAERNK